MENRDKLKSVFLVALVVVIFATFAPNSLTGKLASVFSESVDVWRGIGYTFVGHFSELSNLGSYNLALTTSGLSANPTRAELLAKIKELTDLLALLQQQIAAKNAAQVPCTNLTTNLYWGATDGATGGQVSSLQKYLQSSGDLAASSSGYFGQATFLAVQKFQRRTGIVPAGSTNVSGYGVVGPTTRAKIKALSCAGAPLPPGLPPPPPDPNLNLVEDPNAPGITFTVSPLAVTEPGDRATLSWTARRVSSCTGSGGWTGIKPISNTSYRITPQTTTTYTLTCVNEALGVSVNKSVTVSVGPVAPPSNITFTASPASLTAAGQSSTLSWSAANVTSCAAANGWSGAKPLSGSQVVTPQTTTTYTLSCPNTLGGGQSRASVTVGVGPEPIITAECGDARDNDNDGLEDWPTDPGCSSATDTTETGDPQIQKLYAISWEPSSSNNTPNIVPVYWLGQDGTHRSPANPTDAAQEMTRRAQQGLPRVMQDLTTESGEGFGLFGLPARDTRDFCSTGTETDPGESFTCIWWDNAMQDARTRYQNFFSAFSAAGGQVDYFFTDIENGFSNWEISLDQSADETAARFNAIKNDPRYAASGIESRLGFSDLSNVNNWQHSNDYNIWNSVMFERRTAYLNDTIYNSVRAVSPGVKVGNYGNFNANSSYRLRDGNGNEIAYRSLTQNVVGNLQQPVLYGSIGNIIHSKLDGRNYYEATSFNALRLDVNTLRIAKFSDPGHALAPVIAWKGFREENANISYLTNSNYYQELILHSALTGLDSFYYWNAYSTIFTNYRPNRVREDELVNNLINEFKKVANYSDRQSLVNEGSKPVGGIVDWGGDYVLSGMQAAGRKVWRFTPDVGENGSALSLRVNVGNPDALEFQTSDGILTFPQGVIWTPTNPGGLAPIGLWIIQPGSAPNPTLI